MQSMAQDHYLLTQVKTATPQKLQLLLIDTALRSANRARQYWQQGRNDLAVRALLNAQEVVAQMLAAIDREAGGDLRSASRHSIRLFIAPWSRPVIATRRRVWPTPSASWKSSAKPGGRSATSSRYTRRTRTSATLREAARPASSPPKSESVLLPRIERPVLMFFLSSFLPMGGFCPNLLVLLILHPSSFLPTGGFARTCPKFGLHILHPSSLILPSDGWFCLNLLVLLILHPSSFIPPSDGWFLPELARNSVCSSFIAHPSFRWVVLPEPARKSVCTSFILHPSSDPG